MVYLVILVVVAVAALVRLWLQQRRESTQMDTIEGFSSALDAMAPPSRPVRRNRTAASSGRLRVPSAPKRSLLAWFVADRSGARGSIAANRRAKATARRKEQARAAARRKEQAREAARRQLDARRAARNGDIRRSDARTPARSGNGTASRRIPVAAGRSADGSSYKSYAG